MSGRPITTEGGETMGAQYVVDENGKHVSVILPIEEYERLVEALEDLEDARAADEARAAVARGDDEFIPYEQARKDIAKGRATGR
jgi:PHD/YefM family antitoxin component YafN of YafNO toxin-antitoxin module